MFISHNNFQLKHSILSCVVQEGYVLSEYLSLLGSFSSLPTNSKLTLVSLWFLIQASASGAQDKTQIRTYNNTFILDFICKNILNITYLYGNEFSIAVKHWTSSNQAHKLLMVRCKDNNFVATFKQLNCHTKNANSNRILNKSSKALL